MGYKVITKSFNTFKTKTFFEMHHLNTQKAIYIAKHLSPWHNHCVLNAFSWNIVKQIVVFSVK